MQALFEALEFIYESIKMGFITYLTTPLYLAIIIMVGIFYAYRKFEEKKARSHRYEHKEPVTILSSIQEKIGSKKETSAAPVDRRSGR
ncbi:hypothetical protein [Fusibacter tunisiensis]|uniref:Uncharacterized protein n=1 Tax=Fusibacter tunisiensis TaxID=1008308 RepID=A0ABS2MT93_9FIRM|nr:hypothetical protein [Fusibacter tunisiensis]MBM7562621.1 hypothetical protein [Fusibacter tunisiensis]